MLHSAPHIILPLMKLIFNFVDYLNLLVNVYVCMYISVTSTILSFILHSAEMKRSRRPVEEPPGTSDGETQHAAVH